MLESGRHPLRVLIVDDESLIRWSVAEALRACGHSVIEAADAASALAAMSSQAEPFDAVMLDLWLPDSNDLSLLAAIRRMAPSTAVVMMTAYGTQEDAANAMALGVFQVVEKPFDIHAVESIVAAACRGKRRLH
jgi:DNA-binding NtrC family response regulator